MSTLRVTTFNVNQFSSVAHQKADLLARMRDSDVVLCQETVNLDVEAFAATQKGWAAFQVRHGDNDGHANTAVLYRTSVGLARNTSEFYLGDAKDTRDRFLSGVELTAWFAAGHIFPRRDTGDIAEQLANLGTWVKAHPGPVVIGLDRNQCPPAVLENATGLKWHGVGIDGFLTNLRMANVAEFPKGFSDHAGVHATVTIPTTKGGTVTVKPPAPKYLGPAAHISAGDNMPIGRIVIHSTVSPCEPGGAVEIAAYFRSQRAGGSAHYVVDPSTEVQVVLDSVIAWHAPPNPHSLGIEMCDIPGPVPNDKPGTARYKAAKRAWRWIQPNQRAMLHRTALLTAHLCAAYDVPPRFLSIADLKAGKHGVTTHNNVSQAFHESTHWDPGFWPRRRFMRMVRRHYAELTQ